MGRARDLLEKKKKAAEPASTPSLSAGHTGRASRILSQKIASNNAREIASPLDLTTGNTLLRRLEQTGYAKTTDVEPNNAVGFGKRAGLTAAAGATQWAGNQMGAWGAYYEAGQGGRTQRNNAYIAEQEAIAEQARKNIEMMLADGDYTESEMSSQQNILADAESKLKAMERVVEEKVQEKATQAGRDFAADVTQYGVGLQEEAKEGLGTLGQMLVDAGVSTTQVLLDAATNRALDIAPMGTGELSKNFFAKNAQKALASIPTMGSFANRAFGGAVEEARADGANFTQQLWYGGAQTAKEVATELISNFSLPFKKAYGEGSVDDAVEKLISNVVEKFAKTPESQRILGGALSLIASGVGEGAEEVVGDWLEWPLKKIIYDGDMDSAAEVLAKSLYDFGVGFLSGGVGGTLSADTYNYKTESAKSRDVVEGFAKVMGEEGAKIMREQYDDAQDSAQYADAMTKAYEAGLTGKPLSSAEIKTDDSGVVIGATAKQIEEIYKAGLNDKAKAIATKNDVGYNNPTNKEEVSNGAEAAASVHLRDGSERLESESPGGQVRKLEESAGRVQSWNEGSRPADGEAARLTYGRERVSSAALGLDGGLSDDGIYLVEDGDTEATTEAKRVAAENGLEVVLFAGGDLHTADAPDGARGYYDAKNRKIYVRVDDPDYTAAQIAKHEAGHDMIARGEVDIDAVRERCKDVAPNGNVEELSAMYTKAYDGIGMTADEIWEECICDSLADMNEFGKIFESRSSTYADAMSQIRSATNETKSSRAPPAETQDKASRNFSKKGDKYWHTDLTRAQVEKLEDWVRYDIHRNGNNIGDTGKWTMHDIDGVPVFAIYSTNDESNPTILYEAKGEQGEFEKNFVIDLLEDIKDAKSNNGESRYVGWVLGRGWLPDGGGASDGGRALGRKSNHRNVGVLRGQSKREPSEAIRSVLKNLLKVQESGESSGEVKGKASRRIDTLGASLTDEQQEYFAESKVKDESGKLKVMYQGGKGDFTVFDRKKSKYSNLYGRGFYFTDSESHAKQYGDARAFYLNIVNPLSTEERTITKSQLRKFLEAVAENEDDYSFENYGYDATVGSVLDAIYSGKSDFAMLYDVAQTAIGDMVEAVELFNEVNGTAYDGFILDTETVVFNSEQAKLTSNKNPTSNPDIRYSRRLTERQLIKENKKLRDRIDALERDKKRSDVYRFKEKDINRIARKLVDAFDSYADVKEITPVLQEIADGLFLRKSLNRYSNAKELASEVAQKIVDDSSDLFFVDESYLLDDTISYHKSVATEYVANEIVDMIVDAHESNSIRVDKTTADRTAERIERIKENERKRFDERFDKYKKNLELVKESNEEKLAAVKKKNKDKLAEVRGKRDEKIAAIKQEHREANEKARENRAARKIREKIRKHANKLGNTLLHGTDKKHIPDELEKVVAALLEAINLESAYEVEFGRDAKFHRVKRGESPFAMANARTTAFVKLRDAYKALAGDYVFEDELLEQAASLGNTPISSMSVDDLSTIWDALKMVEKSVTDANKAFRVSKAKTIAEASETIKFDNSAKKDYKELVRGERIRALVGIDMLTPEAFFHRLGAMGDSLFRAMRDAQDKYIRIMKEIVDFSKDNFDNIDVKALEKEIHSVTLGGQNVELSTAQLMELYVLMRRQQARGHILGGGLVIESAKKKKSLFKTSEKSVRGVTLDEVLDAIGKLAPEQIAAAEKMQDFVSNTLSEYGNETSMEVFGYKKFNEDFYWTIRSAEVKKEIAGDYVKASADKGFTKATKEGAKTALKIGSIFDTFSTHSSEMAHYSAWRAVLEDLNRIRNYKHRDNGSVRWTMEDVFNKVFGRHGDAYIAKLLTDITTGASGKSEDTGLTGGLVGKFKGAAVGANLRVIIQQPTALLRAFDVIAPKWFANKSDALKGWEKAKKYAPIAQWKDWGYFDIGTGKQMKDLAFGTESALDKTSEVLMKGAAAADAFSWGIIWNACEAEVKSTRDDAGTDEFYKAVAKRFAEVIDKTQVVDGVLQRSQAMRNKSELAKMATSFMGEPTKQFNMLVSSIYDSLNGDKAAKNKVARTAATLIFSGTINALAQSIIDGLRDDERKKKYWEKFLSAFAKNEANMLNPVQYIPYAKDAFSLLEGYDVSRMDMESISEVINSAKALKKAMDGNGAQSIRGATINFINDVARAFGIPAANIKRDVYSIVRTYAQESNNYLFEYELSKWEKSLNGNKSHYISILYDAFKNDPEAYEIIYRDLVKNNAFKTESTSTSEAIASAMEDKMKEEQGVKHVHELDERYLTPDQKEVYDKSIKRVQKYSVWSKANKTQRKTAENIVYDLTLGVGESKDYEKIISGGKEYGLTEDEFIAYKLALAVVDEPNKSGKLGTFTEDEKREALKMLKELSLTQKEKDYLKNPSKYNK